MCAHVSRSLVRCARFVTVCRAVCGAVFIYGFGLLYIPIQAYTHSLPNYQYLPIFFIVALSEYGGVQDASDNTGLYRPATVLHFFFWAFQCKYKLTKRG